MENKDKQIYLKSVRLTDYKCFKGNNSFSFVKGDNSQIDKIYQWTVFLGNNGTGKTNLLKAIANLEPEPATVDKIEENNKKIADVSLDFAISQGDKMIYNPEINKGKPMYRPKVYERYRKGSYNISASFVYSVSQEPLTKKASRLLVRHEAVVGNHKITSPTSIGYTENSNSIDFTPELANLKIFAYGVNRIAAKQGLSSELPEDAASLYRDDVRLLNFEDWLLQLELASSKNNPRQIAAKKVIKRLTDLFRSSLLFPEIDSFETETDENYNNHILFKTSDGNKFHFKELGYGYQCMFAWIFDFCKRMFDRYPYSDNPLKEAAVVLIDEIDLHLHPKWQRGLIQALSDLFPNTQFIVSTHSPIIVQSLNDINLYILRHQEDGSVKADRVIDRNWEGYQMEEILQELMDVEGSSTSENLKLKLDQFTKACQENELKKAENLYNALKRSVDPNGALMNNLTRQLRYLQNYNDEED